MTDNLLLREANGVAEKLHVDFYEAMMECHGEAMDFVVEHSPGGGFIGICIGRIPIWDSEDMNDGGPHHAATMLAFCRERLNEIASMFAVFKT